MMNIGTLDIGGQWLPMVDNDCQWLPMVANGYQWFCQWLPMVANGYHCPTLDRQSHVIWKSINRRR